MLATVCRGTIYTISTRAWINVYMHADPIAWKVADGMLYGDPTTCMPRYYTTLNSIHLIKQARVD